MTDEFDSSIPDSSSESFDLEPETMPEIPSDPEPAMESMPELIDEPEIESAAEIQPEPESAPELTSELIDEPEIELGAEIQPEPEFAPESTPEFIDEPEIEPAVEIQPEPELVPELMDESEIGPLTEIQPEPDSAPDLMDEHEIEPVAEIQPDLVDEYIGDENPLVDEIPIGDEISVDDNPIDSEPSVSDEVPAGNEITPEIQNESQPETESTPEVEADEIPEYLADLDAISEGDVLQQADLSAANPEMISEQDGLVEEGGPEKQMTAGNEPETNVSSIVTTTGLYSQTGAQGNMVDTENDSIMAQSQINEPSQRQPFKTDYSEDDLGKVTAEINNENTDINKFVQDLKQQGLPPEQYLEQTRNEYAALDAGNSSSLDEHSTPEEQSVNPKTARLFYEGTDPDLVGSSNQEKEREYRIGSPHDDWEDHKNILEGEKQHNIGLAAQTGDKLGEALGILAEASQGNTDFTDADNYIYGKYGHAPYTDAYPQVTHADATLSYDVLQTQSLDVKTTPTTDSSARNDAMTDIPVSPPLPDVVYIAQKDSGDATLQSMPPDTNVIKDVQERDITIRRWGDDGLIQLRAYDSAIGDVPETTNLGTAGMANLKIESELDGPTKVKLQDIVIPPDYRKSGIAGNMLDETVGIAQAKGASEIYGVIENEEALSYWKHMEEKDTGWKVDSSQGAYGYVRYDLNSPQQTQDLPSTISSTASSNQFGDIPVSPSIPGMEKNSKPASENQLTLEEIQQARANNDVEFERELQEDLRKFDENTKPNVQQLLAPTDLPPSNPPGGPPPPDDLPPKPISDGRFQVQQFGDDKQIYLRLHDLEKGAPPDQIYYGDAGRTNLKVEQNDNSTRLRIQDSEVLPGYQEFDSSNTKLMLDKAIQIAHEKGATELYEEIGNNPAKLDFYKNQPEWVVDSSGSYARYSLNEDSRISDMGNALLDANQDRTIVQRELDVDEIRQVLDKTVESANEIKNLDSKDARRNLYQKTSVGTLAEQLCYESTGSANLNEIIPNCPWADGIMPAEVQQIKSHVNTSVDKALGAYSSDLSDLLGGENSKIDKAVDGIWDLRSTEKWASISGSLPQEVALAEDKDSLKQAMLSKSVLRIPSEDVKRVQDYVRKNVVENPQKYGLQNPSETDVEKLVERIKPISPNIDNDQLRLMAKDVFQRKMEIAGFPRGVAYAKH